MPAAVAPFKADRFTTAVPHYVAGRLNYPARLIADMAAWLGISPGDRVLDLGCGPGFLAVAFAALRCEVVGLDPDVAMLAAARDFAAENGVACDFREGSSYDLTPALGPFKLVTMGRSFHWMDRPATLAALDRIVTPDGAVASFRDRHVECGENRWNKALDEVRGAFATPDEFHRLRKSGEVEPHEIMLLDSAFSRLEHVGMIDRLRLTVDGVVERALSFSGSAPAVLGDRRPAFEAAVREAVMPFATDGELTEVVEFSALIGRRG